VENKAVCKSKGMALSILETIHETLKSDTQRAALKVVAEWIEASITSDFTSMSREERQARITELLTKNRNLMSVEKRRETAAFYLEGIEKLEAYGGTNG
jgi:hypothetical protein